MLNRDIKPRILAVDDNQPHLSLLTLILQERGFSVLSETDGQAALAHVEADPPDLILLDIAMPDLNGFQVCKKLKANVATCDIPVIFVSAAKETEDKVKAFQMGGVDYITKPYQTEEVVARVESHLALYFQRKVIEELLERDKLYAQKLTRFVEDAFDKATHDLRNPLASIKTATFLLERYDTLDTVQRQKLLATIRRSTDLMTGLITELMDLAKINLPEGDPAGANLLPPDGDTG